MWNKIFQRLKFYRKIRFWEYLRLNHFCPQVIRTDQSHIIPYKHAVVDLAPGSKIYVGGGDLEIGCDSLRGSKEETRVRLRENAVWSNQGGCRLSYGVTLEVLHGGLLDTQFFTVNSNSVLIAAKKIRLGQDVMIARNVVIYDSDHHTMLNAQREGINPDQPILVGDHVWLTSNVTVLKGTQIGRNSVIGSNVVAHGHIPGNTLCKMSGELRMQENYGSWNRQHPAERKKTN